MVEELSEQLLMGEISFKDYNDSTIDYDFRIDLRRVVSA